MTVEEAKEPSAPDLSHLATRQEVERHTAEWEQYKRELKDEMAALHEEDKAEREKLRVQLDEANEYINRLKEAEAKRDEVKDSKSTMVIPPADIPPQQPSMPAADGAPTAPGEPPKKRPLHKRMW